MKITPKQASHDFFQPAKKKKRGRIDHSLAREPLADGDTTTGGKIATLNLAGQIGDVRDALQLLRYSRRKTYMFEDG